MAETFGSVSTWQMQELEEERIWDNLLVRAVRGRCPISQQLSTHYSEHQEGP